jgi:hypothetical protein
VGKGDAVRARRFLARHGDEVAFELLDLKEADYTGKPGPDGLPPVEDIEKLHRFRELLEREKRHPHRLKDLAVDGNDLIGIGFPPGPALGHALRDLLHVVVEEPDRNTKDELLRHARKLPR